MHHHADVLLNLWNVILLVFLEESFSSSVMPSPLMEIDYPQGHQVVFGNSLTPVDTKQSPVVKFVPSSGDDDAARTHYTLIMVSDVSLVRNERTQMWYSQLRQTITISNWTLFSFSL
jgi:hypothetical protein